MNRASTMLSPVMVLDLTIHKGALGTRMLSDMGARVIRIEEKAGPSNQKEKSADKIRDAYRELARWFDNAGKSSITLDFTNEKGRDIFLRLIKKADVVIESFEPGYLDSLGLGFDILRRKNRKIILVSVTGFGQEGPYSRYRDCELVCAASGGQMHVNGAPYTSPLKLSGRQCSYTASLYSAIGILLALRRRDKTGSGDHLDISIQECIASTLESVLPTLFYGRTSNPQRTARQGPVNPLNGYCLLPCKDGFIQVNLYNQWQTIVEWMNGEDMAADLIDDRWASEAYRREHFSHVVDVVRRWTLTHRRDELVSIGQLMRLPWGSVQSLEEVAACPHLDRRDFFQTVQCEKGGPSVKFPSLPFIVDGERPRGDLKAPLPGEYNTEVFMDELGFSKAECDALSKMNII